MACDFCKSAWVQYPYLLAVHGDDLALLETRQYTADGFRCSPRHLSMVLGTPDLFIYNESCPRNCTENCPTLSA